MIVLNRVFAIFLQEIALVIKDFLVSTVPKNYVLMTVIAKV